MSEPRGREARLKPEYADLYPGLEPDTWLPVENLLRYLATMLLHKTVTPQTITGHRLLREDHFEFRGASPRPDGLPAGLSRLSDAGADPASR
jgi:hypothetical protein